jgi:cytochrome c oxidase subunit III
LASEPVAEPHGHAAHHRALAHHFDSLDQQKESATLGMWLFLVTEIMFFGVLFLAYSIYRTKYPQAFLLASNTLDVRLGGINTAVLIGSSLTMVLAIWAAQVNWRKGIVIFLLATMGLGATFLVIKGFEYRAKFVDYHVPGPTFHFEVEHPSRHLQELAAKDPGLDQHASIYFSLYFIMTGLHALHMIIGICVLAVLTVLSWKGRYDAEYHNPLEMTGLYWHFVDIVWIFLFPLLYLLGAHAR